MHFGATLALTINMFGVTLGNVTRLPITRRQAITAVLGLAVVLLLAARALGHGAQPAAAPSAAGVHVQVGPALRPKLVVHVVGAVRRPGLYRLRDGARVADALAHAGGTTHKANLEAVNLAAPVVDGQQVLVPRTMPAAAGGIAAGAAQATGPISLSSATVDQLDELPGVGPVTAQKIVDYRTAHGAFRSVEELDAVPGIGPARIETLRDLVTP